MTKVANKDKLELMMDQIVSEISQHVSSDELHQVRHFTFYDQVSQRHPVYITLSRLSSLAPFYICPRGSKFIGFKEQRSKVEAFLMRSFLQIMPPENLFLVQRRMSHFYNTPNADFVLAYQVKSAEFGPKWMYGRSRLIPDRKDIPSGYIITIARDIDAILNETAFSGVFSGTGMSVTEETRFRSLSVREKQILRMYSLGKKNGEVSKLLGISPQTLQTHRKNIYKKLEISDSAGLVRYALLLSHK